MLLCKAVVLPLFSRWCWQLFVRYPVRALANAPISITATNVTMPSSGNGQSQYTVTGIPTAGTVSVDCLFSGAISNAKIPNCTYGPLVATPVTAGQTLTGTIQFYPFGVATPVGLHRAPRRSGHLPAGGVALAGVLMLGFRRKAWRWLAVAMLAVGSLAGMSGISGCGGLGFSNAMTPGTYQYTIVAAYNSSTPTILGSIADANVEVTVE
jgi:hypothetical protein